MLRLSIMTNRYILCFMQILIVHRTLCILLLLFGNNVTKTGNRIKGMSKVLKKFVAFLMTLGHDQKVMNVMDVT